MANKKILVFQILLFIFIAVGNAYSQFFFHINDHLGNTRVVLDEQGNVKETYDYYPFGKVQRSSVVDEEVATFKFSGKELDDENGIGLYYFGARYYDAEIGRWWGVDPLADTSPKWSPYNYCFNNPSNYFDPDGTTTYTDSSGNVTNVVDDGRTDIYMKSADGLLIWKGKTIEWNSFCINGDPKQGFAGQIDFKSFEALEFILSSIQELSIAKAGNANVIGLLYYMAHGFNGYDQGNKYDFKTKGGSSVSNIYRGSQLVPGLYLSARDAGNYLAGAVARMFGVPEEIALRTTGSFNLARNASLLSIPKYFLNNPGYPYYGELPLSSTLQRHGWNFRYLNK